MAVPPLLPDDFRDLIPNANGDVCSEFNKALLQEPEAIWETANWAMNADGTMSTAFAEWVCAGLTAIGCSGGTTSTTTGGTGSTTTSTTPAATALVWAVTDTQRFIQLDLATGTVSVIKTGTSTFLGLAEDPTDGTLYGYVANGGNKDFVSVNKVTGAETVIGASIANVANLKGLTFKSDGTLYAEVVAVTTPCATTGTLYTVNKATGVVTSVGTHINTSLGDICFVGSTLYGVGQASCFTDLKLFTLNLSTAASTVINALNPFENAGFFYEHSLAYVNSILWQTNISEIRQINVSTGDTVLIATYDNSTHGRIVGMAKNQ